MMPLRYLLVMAVVFAVRAPTVAQAAGGSIILGKEKLQDEKE